MQNAISHCCLSGGVNRDAKDKCLQVCALVQINLNPVSKIAEKAL